MAALRAKGMDRLHPKVVLCCNLQLDMLPPLSREVS